MNYTLRTAIVQNCMLATAFPEAYVALRGYPFYSALIREIHSFNAGKFRQPDLYRRNRIRELRKEKPKRRPEESVGNSSGPFAGCDLLLSR
jgi:hypothetical protein